MTLNWWIEPARPAIVWANSGYYRELIEWAQGGGWVIEPKHDGVRCMLYHSVDGWQAWSRHQKPLTLSFPVEEALARVPVGAVLDGELLRGEKQLIVWDCPTAEGDLTDRWSWLCDYVPRLGAVRLVRRLKAELTVLDRALADGHEGIVIKRTCGKYPQGETPTWVKVKG